MQISAGAATKERSVSVVSLKIIFKASTVIRCGTDPAFGAIVVIIVVLKVLGLF
jgi:hypothetical protein